MNDFNLISGHSKQIKFLERQLDQDQISHAYLFYGPKGIGKFRVAQEFALAIIEKGLYNSNRKITINHADIIQIGLKEENIKINEIRDLIDRTVTRPLEGTNRVLIIDHADLINPIAQNALLKTIEEPNPGNVFILVTDNPVKLLQTIRSRCQELSFHDLTKDEKNSFLLSRGYSVNGIDLSMTPGKLLEQLENPKKKKELEDYFDRFNKILNKDSFEIFSLAEDLGANKDLSLEVLNFFIQKLYNEFLDIKSPNSYILKTINILIDLLERLSYNVNLRLQWESSLINIIMEPN